MVVCYTTDVLIPRTCHEQNVVLKTIITYGHIRSWNTQWVTDMSFLFADCQYFNEDIGNWDILGHTERHEDALYVVMGQLPSTSRYAIGVLGM